MIWNGKYALTSKRGLSVAIGTPGGVYVIGGYDLDISDCSGKNEIFKDGAWTAKAAMPTAKDHIQAALVDGRIWVPGGNPASTENVSYSITDDEWVTHEPPPFDIWQHAIAGLDGSLYVFGGSEDPQNDKRCLRYDIEGDAWLEIAPMPDISRFMARAEVYDGKILLFGGMNMDNNQFARRVVEYDPAEDTWRDVCAMPMPMAEFGFAKYRNYFLCAGGLTAPGYVANEFRATDRTFIFDLETMSFFEGPPLPVGGYGCPMICDGDGVKLFGLGLWGQTDLLTDIFETDPIYFLFWNSIKQAA